MSETALAANERDPNESDVSPSRHEAIFDAFVEVAMEVEAMLDLDELLHLIARHACELIGVRRCFLYLLGEDGLLHGRVGHSPDRNIDAEVKRLVTGVKVDGFTSEIFEGRAPVLVTDAVNDPRTVRATMEQWKVRDMLGVPMVFGGEVIGVVYLDDMENDHSYTKLDTEVAQAFVSLAASAISQAGMITKLRTRSSLIERQSDHLERLSRIHWFMTQTVLMGDNIPKVLGRLVELVDRPVVLRDRDFSVISWSAPSDAQADTPPDLVAPDTLRAAWNNQRHDETASRRPSVVIEVLNDRGEPSRHLLASVRVEMELAGYLEVVDPTSEIDELDVTVAEHAATVVALVILSERRAVAVKGHEKEDLFGDLLQGARDPNVLARRAFLFGIDLSQSRALALFARQSDSDITMSQSRRRQMLGAMVEERSGVPCSMALSLPEGEMLLLGPFGESDPAALDPIRSAANEILENSVHTLGLRRAVVSEMCRSAEDYRIAHQDLRDALTLVDGLGWHRRVVLPADLGVLRLLKGDRQRSESLQYAADLLGPLIEHDAAQSTNLIGTLQWYIDSNASTRATAERMRVHENTIRYRLARVKELSGVDAEHLDDLVNIRFALQVLDQIRVDDVSAVR